MWMICEFVFLAVLLVLAITLYFTRTFLGSSYMHLHYTYWIFTGGWDSYLMHFLVILHILTFYYKSHFQGTTPR
jgi:hypothetical protein